MRIAPHERGRLHVFAVNQPQEALAKRFQPAETGADRLQPDPAILAELTGAEGLDPAGAELIPLRDLAGLGLSGYLAQGHDIPEEALAPQMRRLDALEGYALVLTSRAFGGAGFALAETADLTHIASFDQPGTDWSSAGSLPSEAAKPHSAPPQSPRAARRSAQRIGGIIVAAFLIGIALILWAVLA